MSNEPRTVLDTNVVSSAALLAGSLPARVLRHVVQHGRIVFSEPTNSRTATTAAHEHVTRYSVPMNITLSLDDDLIAAAKSLAARRGTSVTGLVRLALEQQVAVDQQASESGASGVQKTLIDYSTGRIPRSMAMQDLGIDDYGTLLRLMNMAGLPHPVVPLATRKAMAQRMVAMIKAAVPAT